MSFFKSFVLAIIATLMLTYVFGVSFIEWFNISIYLEDEYVQPFAAISLSALVVVILVIVAIAIIVSVFGSIIFVVMLSVGAIMLLSIGIFWPILLIALLIWLCCREPFVEQN